MKFADQFRSGLLALDSERFENLNLKDGYTFYPVISRNWKESDKRLLVVMESVDRSDLMEGRFLNTRRSDRGAFNNPITNALPLLLDRAHQSRCDWEGSELYANDFAFGAVNFNAAKTRGLSPTLVKSRNQEFAARVSKIISYMRPTHVLCCGFSATMNLLELSGNKEAPHAYIKNGWVFQAEFEGVKVQFSPTLDLDVLCSPPSANDDSEEDEGEGDGYGVTDLLYFVCRNATNLLLGYNPYSLRGKFPKPVLVNTIRKFDALMEHLHAAEDLISVDTETQNLETVHNKIYFVQFSTDGVRGYCVPVDHPHESNPFSAKERIYIKKRLRRFFSEDRDLKTMVFQNGMFDLRVIRYQLNIKFIHHKLHELTAGEQLLDENIGILTRLKLRMDAGFVSVSYQGLKNMLCLYENDFYYDESRKVNKTNRGRLSSFPVDDHDTLLYCAADVVLPWHVAKKQLDRANHVFIRTSPVEARESYGPWYERHLHNVMNAVCVSISHMEQDGSYIDMDYMKKLMDKDSPILLRRAEVERELKETPNAKKAETRIMKGYGRSSSLFAGYSTNAFSLSKKAHLETLFFDVMKLPVVSYTDTGARAIDKVFIKEYSMDHPEVKLFGEYTAASKMFSTYIKGWVKKLKGSVDSALDNLLRARFGFFTIVTGRLNSYDPSLQQVPSRGPLAPIIHRAFVAPPGHLNIQADLNAAECRGASVLSGDEAYASAFKVGQKLRRMFMMTPTDEIKKRLKVEGDIHIMSVKMFFGKVVDKSDPLRSAIKAIVFGVLYGKSVKTLGRDLRNDAVSGLINERRSLTSELRKGGDGDDWRKRVSDIEFKLKDIEVKLKEAEEKDWTAYAQETMDKFFEASVKVKQYLDNSVAQAVRHLHVISPAGRVRNLWRVLSGKPGVIAAASRRAQNSPIQGFSSEMGCVSAYKILKSSYFYLKKYGSLKTGFPKYSRAVHDANYYMVPYESVIPFIHIFQYEATQGVADWYAKVMKVPFTIEPEIEMDIGAHDAATHTWSWDLVQLATIFVESLKTQIEIGTLNPEDFDASLDAIVRPWADQTTRDVLFSRFPLQNVREDMNHLVEACLEKVEVLRKEYHERA